MSRYRQAVRPTSGGTALTMHVVPRARRRGVDGLHGDAVKVRITAPPTGGKANRELLSLLASVLGVPVSDVEIVAGERSRSKTVLVRGLEPPEVAERLAGGG